MKTAVITLLLVAFAAALGFAVLVWSTNRSVTPTFNRDVAPLVFKHCSGCHRPGESAPFSLLTFRDLQKRAAQVAYVTKNRIMPPWLPHPEYGDFIGERQLSNEQIALIQRWVDGGTAEGDPSDLPPEPTWPQGWLLGEPDLVAKMERPYTLPASGKDVYRNFVIPIPITKTRYVEAVELRPGNKRVVHHANILIDPTRSSKARDEEDAEPGFAGMDVISDAQRPGGYFLTWVPGTLPSVKPTAWRLEPRSDLVIAMHMLPSGKAEVIDPVAGFHFTDKPVHEPLQYIFKLEGDDQIDILPGEEDFAVTDDFTLPIDVEVLGVDPHAHYLGKAMQGFATLPDGTRKWLIRIDDWDFNWQDVYRYRRPVFLPKGSTVSMRYTYDNSAHNRRNPHTPPRRVVAGNSTFDEMAHLWIQFKARDRNGLNRLEAAYALHVLEKYPNNAAAHYNLARHHHLARRFEQAMHHYKHALRSRPGFALAHHNAGSALRRLGRLDEAIEHYQAVIELRPHYAPAHSFLARTLHEKGELGDAISHYHEALKLNPNDLAAHYHLATALRATDDLKGAEQHLRIVLKADPQNPIMHHELGATVQQAGRAVEALRHYHRSLELKDDSPNTLTLAAWILAAHPDDEIRRPTEAVKLAERASELTGRRHPGVEDTLAVACAAVGDFNRAVKVAQRSIELLLDTRDEASADTVRSRMKLYEQSQPYRDPSMAQNASQP